MKTRLPHRPSRQIAFTLVEIAIVMVIIALLIGGVLTGRDMLRSAEVNSQVSQLAGYHSAVSTFRTKYNNSLPGDMTATLASQYGFRSRGSCSGANPGTGDGNGLIAGTNGCTAFGTYQGGGETALFWADLSQVGLVESTYTLPSFGPGNLSVTSSPDLSAYFPPAKFSGHWVLVYSSGGYNYYAVTRNPSIQPNGPAFSGTGAIPVIQAYNFDLKIDDGLPQSGTVTTQGGFNNTVMNWASGGAPGGAVSASSTTCHDNAGNVANIMKYSVTQNSGAGTNCSLSVRF